MKMSEYLEYASWHDRVGPGFRWKKCVEIVIRAAREIAKI